MVTVVAYTDTESGNEIYQEVSHARISDIIYIYIRYYILYILYRIPYDRLYQEDCFGSMWAFRMCSLQL